MVLLQIGDIIYGESYQELNSRNKITKVTDKFAFCGTTKFKREYQIDSRLTELSADKWKTTSYYVETPELKKQWEIKYLKYYIRDKFIDWNLVPIEDLRTIYNILKRVDQTIVSNNKKEQGDK
jgi:hypothetical protein